MVRKFRLALAQINSTVGDIPGNTAKIIEYVERAREAQADMVAFPELAITGYPPEDLLFKTSFLQANVEAMRQVVAAAQGKAGGGGPEPGGGDAFADGGGGVVGGCRWSGGPMPTLHRFALVEMPGLGGALGGFGKPPGHRVIYPPF